MTPDEMLDALGPGWERGAVGFERIPSADRLALFVMAYTGRVGWVVKLYDGGPRRITLPCPSPEAAVAVAHLLVAAEQIADGAEVAEGSTWVHVEAMAHLSGPERCPATVAIRDDRWGTFREQCVREDGHDGLHALRREACDPSALLVWPDPSAAPVTPFRLCGVECQTERQMAEARGRDVERARVVAYLRGCGGNVADLAHAGDKIGWGEHWLFHDDEDPF